MSVPSKTESVPSKTDQLAVVIRDAIRRGELAGGALYSAQELGQRFGVSRTPVREALLRLADAGLVTIEKNRGVRIATASESDLAEIFTLRLLLEPPAARRAAARMSPDELLRMDTALQEMRDTAEDVEAFFAADHRFHQAILHGSGNSRLAGQVANLRDAITLQGRRTIPGRREARQVIAEHERIARAITARAPSGAAHAMRQHLLNSAELLVGDEESVGYLDWQEWVGGGGCCGES
ncbi:GntR family transcriptional regulator [Streptomyces sp. LHD-70]|uniref:GntR family transcriptional regulator n=1 Tax=Streptomyces sp. LHD-70 TaxID=3072140 RepID=UPI00280C5EE5|nr:GntR family transcriptional regulator [Streptomyces sp. LHD-70]MDQ8703803.1 GntR family transcriptional regulator [Streptomyces sp. LHD-70]